MSGRKSRDKGNRFERYVVQILTWAGQKACRVPLSGSAGGQFKDDILWQLPDRELRLECKSKANGFKFIYDNLKPHVPLIIKADRRDPLFVCNLTTAIELIGSKAIVDRINSLESPQGDTNPNSLTANSNTLRQLTTVLPHEAGPIR